MSTHASAAQACGDATPQLWDDENPVCPLCGKPMVAGQAIYTVTPAHYDCQFPNGQKAFFEQAKADMDNALEALGFKPKQPKKREGTGAIATKAKAMAVEAIERELGAKLLEVVFWNQQGAYRGKAWDLDRWGLDFEFVRNGCRLKGSSSTLATMTDCVKAKSMRAMPSDLAFSFTVEPTWRP